MKSALKVAAIILVVLFLLAFVGLRVARGFYSSPLELKPGFVEVEGLGIHIFGAQVAHKIVLFDTGMDPEGRAVDALIGFFNATRADVSEIFLTHGHPDHIAAVNLFPAARVRGGAADADWMAGKVKSDLPIPWIFQALAPVPPSRFTDPLFGEDEVPVGEGKSVRCFPAPGHSPGSYVFLYDRVLLTGDVMLFDGTRLVGPQAAFDANSEQNKQAVRALEPMLGKAAIDAVCTAHGGCTPMGHGRRLLEEHFAALSSDQRFPSRLHAAHRRPALYREAGYATARSVISRPRSIIANPSRSSRSVMQSGGLVKNVFQRTKV